MTLIERIRKCLSTCRKSQALALLVAASMPATAQTTLATLEVVLDRPSVGIEIPVSIDVDAVTHLPDSALGLIQIQGKMRTPVAFQIDNTDDRKITWLVNDTDKNLRFELVSRSSPVANPIRVKAEKKDGGLILVAGNRNLLRYQYETKMPPTGINEVFKRSGYIHPLWSPKGQVLTRIQPPDHYHHYGLWNPWTHVLFEGDTVDFWNLNARQGTVRFTEFLSVIDGSVFGEYAAIHDHVAFTDGQENLAIRELQTVRVYAPERADDYYIADITVSMVCPEKPVRLLEYRYGGIGWRATEKWTRENSRVLSSDGKTRKDADGSTARWCIVEGTVDGETAGAVMMSYPANYNHPEPLRIWPENANRNRGDMFANFSPTKNMDWPLDPGNRYVLRYRFIVFDGEFGKEKAEAGWHYFASPPLVKISKQ